MHFGRTIAAGTHDVQGDSHDVQGDSIAHAMQQYLYITHVMNADEIFSSDQIRPGIVYFASSEVRPESGMIIPDSCLLDVPVVVGMCACVHADRNNDGWFQNFEDEAQCVHRQICGDPECEHKIDIGPADIWFGYSSDANILYKCAPFVKM